MSRNGKMAPVPAGGWLDGDQQRAWLAYIRVQLRALRDLRKIAESARNDLREGLGPEFAGFEIEDLNPKRLAQRHLFGGLNADQAAQQQPAANGTPLTPGERPPSDPNAT